MYSRKGDDNLYESIKFYTDGRAVLSGVDKVIMSSNELDKKNRNNYRYRINNEEIEIEYLRVKYKKMYNIIKYGRISKDTIVFYKAINLQHNNIAKPSSLNEIYIKDK
ncbi:hypothetical protein N7U66_03355 [Lacinutrix neustonica]|uniref:Uncharacterized protein n=1 Tax=Lacinutrix neustonica TaxID=2980107 RepID=A0A9E8SE33_9FLAO|nr:hypothetical protein [Lacinutrix neustonica]WAC02721.1 hypothetical protein N7U66_03355 [Lacinutrix neustonica]